jgi:hypothetical protein
MYRQMTNNFRQEPHFRSKIGDNSSYLVRNYYQNNINKSTKLE